MEEREEHQLPAGLEQHQIDFFNSWADREYASYIDSLPALGEVLPSNGVYCGCNQPAMWTEQGSYLCASGTCDFCSGADGVDVSEVAWQFMPGQRVRFLRLPETYSYLDGKSVDSLGDGVVEDLAVCEQGLVIAVYLKTLVICELSPDEIFTSAWFSARDLQLLEGEGSPHSMSEPHRAPPVHHAVHRAGCRTYIPPNSIRPFVVRYSTLWKAIGIIGLNLSHKPVDSEVWNKRYDNLSQPLEFDGEYDLFLSYRWMTGRLMLLLSVLVNFNHLPAALLSFGVTVFILFIASLVHEYGHVRLLPYLSEDDSYWQQRQERFTTGLDVSHVWTGSWYFSLWFMTILMCCGLVCIMQIISWQKIFFDKTCINQINRGLNSASLFSLPFILSKCKSLLAIVDTSSDSGYFNRLWCLFEVAMFMRLRPAGRVKFVYVSQCLLFVILFLGNNLVYYLQDVLANTWLNNEYAEKEPPTVGKYVAVPDFIMDILNFVLYILSYLAARAFFNDEHFLRQQREAFDVRSAECGVAEDKPILLDQIRKRFSDGIGAEDALNRFNVEVRNILSNQVLSRSFRILPYSMVVAFLAPNWLTISSIMNINFLDSMFYWLPWSRRNDYFTHLWFKTYIMNQYNLFLYSPFNFYISTLIWKAAHVIEMKLRVPWWIVWLPVIIVQAIWDSTSSYLYTWIYYSAACVFQVSNQCPVGDPDFKKFAVIRGWMPFDNLFDAFWTNWLEDDDSIPLCLTPTCRAFGFILFLFVPFVVYCIHEPPFCKRVRRRILSKFIRRKKQDNGARLIHSETTPMPDRSRDAVSSVRQRQNSKSIASEHSEQQPLIKPDSI